MPLPKHENAARQIEWQRFAEIIESLLYVGKAINYLLLSS